MSNITSYLPIKFIINFIKLFLNEMEGMMFTILTIFLILIITFSILLTNKRNQPFLLGTRIAYIKKQNNDLTVYIKVINPKITTALATENLENQSVICCNMHQPSLSEIKLINK